VGRDLGQIFRTLFSAQSAQAMNIGVESRTPLIALGFGAYAVAYALVPTAFLSKIAGSMGLGLGFSIGFQVFLIGLVIAAATLYTSAGVYRVVCAVRHRAVPFSVVQHKVAIAYIPQTLALAACALVLFVLPTIVALLLVAPLVLVSESIKLILLYTDLQANAGPGSEPAWPLVLFAAVQNGLVTGLAYLLIRAVVDNVVSSSLWGLGGLF
jgi:hypothetical protein